MKLSFPKIHFKIQINKIHNLSPISHFKVTNDDQNKTKKIGYNNGAITEKGIKSETQLMKKTHKLNCDLFVCLNIST